MNFGHWQRVRKARAAQGLPKHACRGPVEGHALVGRRFQHESGRILVVERVLRDWLGGWFEVAQLRDVTLPAGAAREFHPLCNVDSRAQLVLRAVAVFQRTHALI